MPATDILESAVLGHLLGSTTWAKPETLYIGLLLATPADEGGMVEVDAADYARQPTPPGDAHWLEQEDKHRLNANQITFANPETDWGLVTAVGLFSAETDGHLLAYELLDTPRDVVADGPLLIFQPGALAFRMNDF